MNYFFVNYLKLMVFLSAFIPTCFIMSCAPVKVSQVALNESAKGITYYEPKPYLWAEYDPSTKKMTHSIVWLPDYSKRMQVKIRGTLFGSNSQKVSLVEGWKFAAIDATDVSGISDMLTAITETLGQVAAMKGGETEESLVEGVLKKDLKEIETGLYEIFIPDPTHPESITLRLVSGSPSLKFTFQDVTCNPNACGCDYDSKKFSDGSTLCMTLGESKRSMQCDKGTWTDKGICK